MFSAILRAPGATQGEIRSATRVDRSTISAVLAKMERDGVVRRLRGSGHGAGRPEDSFHLRAEAGLLVGLVVTRGEVRLAGAGLDGARKAELAARFRAEDEAGLAEACIEAVKELIHRCGNLPGEVAGVGVAFPGPHPGLADSWQPGRDAQRRIADRLEAALGRPVCPGSRPQAMALGEHRFGAARALDSFVFVDIDQDVGAAVVVGERVLQGFDGLGSRLGHVKVETNGHPCPCGGRGCLARYVGAAALLARMAEFGRSMANLAMLDAAARADDKLARTVLLEAGSYLGLALANIGNALGIADFVLAGEVSHLADHLVPAIDEMLRRNLVPPLSGQHRVHRSQLRPDAALDGAIALAMDAFMPSPVVE